MIERQTIHTWHMGWIKSEFAWWIMVIAHNVYLLQLMKLGWTIDASKQCLIYFRFRTVASAKDEEEKNSSECIKLTSWLQVNQTKSWTLKRRCGCRFSQTCARTASVSQPTRERPLKWPAKESAKPKAWATVASNEITELLEVDQCLLDLQWWSWCFEYVQ